MTTRISSSSCSCLIFVVARFVIRITPSNKRGYVQGLNLAVVDGAGAIAPFAYGALADAKGVPACLWTAAAISLLGALINIPLIFNQRLVDNSPQSDDESLHSHNKKDTSSTSESESDSSNDDCVYLAVDGEQIYEC